ncbi:MAG: hypothetical protein M0038_03900 [Pseudomonadota bacterium]|nr:hypothetical protein [Pseudomonadota bacterium]
MTLLARRFAGQAGDNWLISLGSTPKVHYSHFRPRHARKCLIGRRRRPVRSQNRGRIGEVGLLRRPPGHCSLQRNFLRPRAHRNPFHLGHRCSELLPRVPLSLAQAFLIERQVLIKKTGHLTRELAYGITSRPASEASPQHLLEINRGHWVIENRCHYVIDWNFDEDRSHIRSGHGPENVTRLRRFAVALIHSKPGRKVAETLRRLNRNIRSIFDYLLMSENARRTPCAATTAAASH